MMKDKKNIHINSDNWTKNAEQVRQIENQILQRMDLTVCQTLPSIIDIIYTTIHGHPNVEVLFTQVERCG